MNIRNRAFTLIELLVVIAIIAVLASIALPAYRSVQEKAHGTQDANDLRQLGIGMVAYLGDHDDTMFSTLNTTGSNSWSTLLGPTGSSKYVGDWHVFQSPFDKRPYTDGNVSYGINQLILSSTINSTTSYNHPSELMVFAPNPTGKFTNLQFSGLTTSNSIVSPGSVPGTMNYGTYLNVLYQDAHIGTVKADSNNFNNSNFNPSPNGGLSQFWSPYAQ